MKKFVFIIFTLATVGYLTGCGKKEAPMESGEAISMEALTTVNIASPALPETKISPAPALVPLPPSGPYQPSATEIQTALKNAGFYSGEIDGKIGRMSRKAIEDFQQANSLKVDGKVGPKTWEVLKKYLNPVPQPAKKKR